MRRPVLTRRPDWEARLVACLRAAAEQGFHWGSNDCALFGADAVAALTGQDFGAAFRGKYDDAESARAALREFGRGTIVRTFDAHLRRVHAASARRGDLTMVAADGCPMGSVGVVLGSDAAFVDDIGLYRRPRAAWLRCWSVG